MAAALEPHVRAGVSAVAFGDLFLADVRAYREAQLAQVGLAALFPLWGCDTGALAREMIAGGLRTVVTCVDPQQLDPAFVGRAFDDHFLDDLPPGVVSCGERGEFHTCVVDGPMFAAPIPVTVGNVVDRDGFVFADLTLSSN
jgi:diphthamide synthase (EF-2-diphthine--ammonia ligase)